MNNIASVSRWRAALLALLLALPVLASSPEHLVGGTHPTAADRSRFDPRSASNGTDYFVVWGDVRSETPALFGTRVTREGRILDPLGIRIAGASTWISPPQVTWDGDAYLVAWTAFEASDAIPNIFAARIAPTGEMVMPPRLLVANALLEDDGRALASNGTVNVLAYLEADHRAGRIAVFDRNAETIRHEELAPSEHVGNPAVAAGASGFAVAWASSEALGTAPSIRAVALDASGHISGERKRFGSGDTPSVASNGSSYIIAWRRNLQWEEFSLRSRTLDASLAPLTEELTHFTSDRQLDHVTVLPIGNRYEVLAARFVEGGVFELVSVQIDGGGHPQPLLTRNRLIGEVLYRGLSPATNGTDILIARDIDGGLSGTQIFAQLYRGNATAPSSPQLLLSWSGNAHHEPQIASSAAGSFVAWTEQNGSYATRIDAAGRSLDGRGILLATYPYTMTRVAFDGTNWVVASREASSIGVRFISPADGSTVAEAHVPVNTDAFGLPGIALATSPDATYLVFTDSRTRVARIPKATHTPDPVPLVVSPEDMMNVTDPAAAWNGSELLVVWNRQDYVPRADPPTAVSIDVWAARVTAGLSLLDPAPLLVAERQDHEDALGQPSVASNGRDWLVVVASGWKAQIFARRITDGGMLVGNAATEIGKGFGPVATWDGTRYAVAWKEGELWELRRSVMLHVLPSAGDLAVQGRTLVARDVIAEGAPSIAPAANAVAAVAYTRISFQPEHAGVQRSFFRVMDSIALARGRAVRR
jgi:hypothetical protein